MTTRLHARILTILGVGGMVGGADFACSSSVETTPTGGGSGGTATSGSSSTTTATSGSSSTTTTATSGSSSTTATSGSSSGGTGGAVPLVCAPVQPKPDAGPEWGLEDQCFTGPELAPFVLGDPGASIGTPCNGGVLCPAMASLGPYDASCASYFTSEPYTADGKCCYSVSCGCCGRPFVVEGVARHAAPVRRAGWGDGAPAAGGLSLASAAALRDAWLGDAVLEHASIASFARFTLQLLALGAPADLVAASQRASLDEVAHAEDCFSLASRYAGEPLGPGALALGGALPATTLAEAAASAVEEGCVGETLAALIAGEQLHVAGDAAVRRALARIAEDEARHAELAWRFVRWALDQDARIAPTLARAFAAALERVERSASDDACAGCAVEVATWHHHGRLDPATLAAAKRRAAAEVLAPCAAALLSARC